ncbi:MAG: hypothetical protein ACKPKO_49645, partial [Candidatus Fonsibacter sp.]
RHDLLRATSATTNLRLSEDTEKRRFRRKAATIMAFRKPLAAAANTDRGRRFPHVPRTSRSH